MKALTGYGLLLIAACAASFFFSSCMHAVMAGGIGGHGSEDADHSGMEPTLEKEATTEEVKAIANFPAIELGKEAVFLLRLSNIKTGEPIRRAKVYALVEFGHSPVAHQGMNHMAMPDSSNTMKMEETHRAEFPQEVDESSVPGTYSFPFKPTQSGIYAISYHVTEIEGQTLSPSMLIGAKRMVSNGDEKHHGMGMIGMGSSTKYAILGLAVMGAMMLTMWLVRGSIF